METEKKLLDYIPSDQSSTYFAAYTSDMRFISHTSSQSSCGEEILPNLAIPVLAIKISILPNRDATLDTRVFISSSSAAFAAIPVTLISAACLLTVFSSAYSYYDPLLNKAVSQS
jgi:hypothetical protein